jgi:chitinase
MIRPLHAIRAAVWKTVTLTFISGAGFASARANDLWVTGYYPGWEQSSMAASNLDFSVLTHVIHFSVLPNTDGSIDSTSFGLTPSASQDVISRAHVAGRKALICVGGSSTETGFQGATTPGHLSAFISNLTNFMAARGYDGIDLDWEPLPMSDSAQFTNLVNGLRTALNTFPQPKLLTAAVGAYPVYGDSATGHYLMFAALQQQFDQINIMTYDQAGPWPGWVTWFNSPIFDGGYRFPSTGGLVPSIAVAVSNFLAYGVAPSRLGLGTPFYGYIWTGNGITSPRQSWPATNPPATALTSYASILSTYYQTNRYHWDEAAQAAYLSVTNANPMNDMFISYDDIRACQAKVSYARNLRMGGLMIWELAQDYFPLQPAGQRHALLSAIKAALATPAFTGIQMQTQAVTLTFTAIPLGSYSVQWAGTLAGPWSTLVITNTSAPAGTLQVTDPNAPTQAPRFYRIVTPP